MFFYNFYPNEADKRSLLFSLPFPKVSEYYFHYKRSYMGEKENWLVGHVVHLGHDLINNANGLILQYEIIS